MIALLMPHMLRRDVYAERYAIYLIFFDVLRCHVTCLRAMPTLYATILLLLKRVMPP